MEITLSKEESNLINGNQTAETESWMSEMTLELILWVLMMTFWVINNGTKIFFLRKKRGEKSKTETHWTHLYQIKPALSENHCAESTAALLIQPNTIWQTFVMHGLRITSLEHTDVFFGQIIRLVEQTLRIRPLNLVIFTTLAMFACLCSC